MSVHQSPRALNAVQKTSVEALGRKAYRDTTAAAVGIVGAGVLADLAAKFLGRIGTQRAAVIAWACAFGCQRCALLAWVLEVCSTPLRTLAVALGKGTAD